MIELMSIAGSGQRLFFIVDSDPTATALKEWGEVHRVAVETAVPHYGFEDNIEESNRLLDQITEHRTTILVMAVGAPKSEVWVWRHQCELPTCWALCTGQAVRIALGLTARAPKLIRSLHGEWLWRICQEPRRLAGRYIRGSAMFLVAVLEDSLRRKDRASNELVDLYGQICDAMPPNLVSELKMVDFDDGIGVTIRSGKKLWFASDTSASVIARCIVGSICGSSAKKVPLKTAIYGNEK
jgi:exopolysaccharide biosynthesis WecB/TagA/CpsF family protein